jgi:hypothetical protein
MKLPWTPWKAAIVVFLVVVVAGGVIGGVLIGASGNLHDKPFARGEALGTGVGTLAAIAGAAAYFIQARRRG